VQQGRRWENCVRMIGWCDDVLYQGIKKSSLLFDYACHSCSETMLIFSVYLSVCLMPDHKDRAKKKVYFNIYKC
jgi:hypothetical protein